jgi:hypothetical protein
MTIFQAVTWRGRECSSAIGEWVQPRQRPAIYAKRGRGSAAIISTHDFFVATKWKDGGGVDVLGFYAVMTVLIGAIFVAVVANSARPLTTTPS